MCKGIQSRPHPEERGAVQVVTVPPAEIPRWQELRVFPFLLFIRYFERKQTADRETRPPRRGTRVSFFFYAD